MISGYQRLGVAEAEADVDKGLAHCAEGLVLQHLHHQLVDGHGAAHTGGQLDEQLGAGLMKLRQPLRQILEHLLVLVEPASAHGVADALHTRQHQTHVVLGAVQDVVGGLLIEMARLHPAEQRRAAHGGLHDTVLDLHIADLPGGKQRTVFFVHSVFLLRIFSILPVFTVLLYRSFGETTTTKTEKLLVFRQKCQINQKGRRPSPSPAYSASVSVSAAGCCVASYSASACASTFLSWRLCTCVRSNFSHRSGRRAMVRL